MLLKLTEALYLKLAKYTYNIQTFTLSQLSLGFIEEERQLDEYLKYIFAILLHI